ncbi:MAG TPA: hypothetical protein ACFYEA_01685 [Candidatus Tripitaka californicus]
MGAEPQCYSPGAPPPGLALHQRDIRLRRTRKTGWRWVDTGKGVPWER